jgi:hypothetical protein
MQTCGCRSKPSTPELAKRGFTSKLAKGDGYFCVWSGEATDGGIGRCVPTLRNLTLDQWVDRIQKLRERSRELIRADRTARFESSSLMWGNLAGQI